MNKDPWAAFSCALDFCRALNERHSFFRWLFRVAVGKYAYREYQLLINNLLLDGFDPRWEYGCEECSYHKKKYDWEVLE
jgi:hypothetical protein